MKKLDAFQIALFLSIISHLMFFVIPSLLIKENNPDFKDYTLVQLLETRPRQAKQAALKKDNPLSIPKESGQIIPKEASAPQENNQQSDPAGEDSQYSDYVPFFQVMQLPEFISKIRPVYPQKAKFQQLESEVLVEVYIDANGKPRKVIVLKSGGQEFDDATVEAVYKSLFSPAISKERKAIPVRVRIPFKFELE